MISRAALVGCVLALAACTSCARPAALTVDPSDQRCSVDQDCTMAMTRCTGHCGVPINKARWPKYLDAQEQLCRSYAGPMKKVACNQVLACVQGVCKVVADPR